MTRKRWIKLWTQEWIGGTTRREMTPEERSVWADFLALAGDSPDPGAICFYSGVPITDDQLCKALDISPALLVRAKEKMLKFEKIHINEGVIHITNWERYQETQERAEYMRDYMREKRQREKEQAQAKSDVNVNSKQLTNVNVNAQQEEQNRTEGRGGEQNRTYKLPTSITPTERDSLGVLKGITHWPFNANKDLEYLRQLAMEFPTVDIAGELPKFAAYQLDHPLGKKGSPRLRLRNWVSKAAQFQEERDGTKAGIRISEGHSGQDAEEGWRTIVSEPDPDN